MTQHILSLSYGKDSLACLGVIEQLGWPLDRIVHAEIWATDTIPADLPPMIEFKKRADEIIRQRWGIEVEHICATDRDGTKLTYEKIFYRTPKRKEDGGFEDGTFAGFPYTTGAWCNDRLKTTPLDEASEMSTPPPDLRVPDAERHLVQHSPQGRGSRQNCKTGFATKWSQYCTGELKRDALDRNAATFSESPTPQGADTNSVVQYIGIAADEPERLKRLGGTNKKAPLAEIGWTENDAYFWCIKNKLLSPIYTTSDRGGCWFCHNQTIASLRLLRKRYPHLWALMMKWDTDSPVTFHSDGRTIHDFDLRFSLEMQGKVPCDRRFRWKMIDELKEE